MCIWGEGFQYEAEKEAVLCCIASENPSVSRFSFRDFDICYMIYTVKPTSVHWWPNGEHLEAPVQWFEIILPEGRI